MMSCPLRLIWHLVITRLIPEEDDVHKRTSLLRSLAATAKFAVQESRQGSDSGDSDSDASSVSDESDVDLGEIADDLRTDIDCLIDLEPLIKTPFIQSTNQKETDYLMPQSQSWTPEKTYLDRIGHRFPKARLDLVARLAKANWDRFQRVRLEKERVTAAQREIAKREAHTRPSGTVISLSEQVSFVNDSGLGTSVATGSAYAETTMSYRQKNIDGSVKIPPLPSKAKKGVPFECLSCGRQVRITNNSDWKTVPPMKGMAGRKPVQQEQQQKQQKHNGKRICIKCSVDDSLRWWPMMEQQLTNDPYRNLGSETQTFADQREFQCHRCHKAKRKNSQSPEDASSLIETAELVPPPPPIVPLPITGASKLPPQKIGFGLESLGEGELAEELATAGSGNSHSRTYTDGDIGHCQPYVPTVKTPPDGVIGPKIWTGDGYLPRYVQTAEVPEEGLCYFYDDGSHCKTVINGAPVNAFLGVTKAGLPRESLEVVCTTCRGLNINCDTHFPSCGQCSKSGRACKYSQLTNGT
ncbi:hypothetical protein CPLU01_11528 [Colletotrichum plurivorum]|uniref:Zn(2)-C6 fungal-type domain-containing protein n=1 Tax=Colletotrichum plurivorum TaxID=2175906 RepID=A0A8H6K1J0_9PEZI|nr:hypothetical protein CPLU01_11528 [Colletotrichum plurivorum]